MLFSPVCITYNIKILRKSKRKIENFYVIFAIFSKFAFEALYIQGMANENNDIKNLDLDQLIGNMSSINSEDYWFTKVSKIEEHDETAEPKQSEQS